ncbi:sugar ABC transporter ATP-binding protein [Pacificibacter marinus]|uniref:Ribose import ATP-binding protein RbsA n=1 Tax=Pacificibacter marinus TaxID=658057 RepID=A0A1Y5RFC0_9RHOB|nr:sugar ABC transporter ATP-binding protein [Pacificibacter marinus]SEK22806.1 ribose transport system ATP-binding protein [Pacificibacter marinus]SLN14889.1 Ribose import ATP-binding protein RbsA [Pacificibacter marinus]
MTKPEPDLTLRADHAFLTLRGLKKHFGGAKALDGADLVVEAGSVHSLVGENGAGKSTLIKTLSGLIVPDAGEILVDGLPVTIAGVQHAESLGFRFIHQELSLVPYFTAVENAFIGRPYPRKGPFIDRAAMRRTIEETARSIAPDLPLDIPVGQMTTGQKQLVEIIRALIGAPARLIVMDEPTASLSDGEAARLHEAVKKMSDKGVAVIFISHRLDEVMQICDSFTVLRSGCTVGAGRIAETDRAGLVHLMSGREEVRGAAQMPAPDSPVVLRVRDVPYGSRGTQVSFDIRAGEILGLYGLVGAGRSSLMKLIWGAQPHAGGQIELDGKVLRAGRISDRIAKGAAYVPEDRRNEGLITSRSIADNLAVSQLPKVRHQAGMPWTSRRKMVERSEAVQSTLSVKMGSPWDGPLTLSGGNQQKLLFGRWFGQATRLLILDEPSRGVDVGAKAEIHALARRFAAQGAAVLMTTSDMDELMALSARVLVLASGEITAELTGDSLTPTRVIDAAFQHQTEKETQV